MSIRRTRKEKIEIQQRREQEKYEWKEEKSSIPVKSSPGNATKAASQSTLSQETLWLRKDLLQTVIALLVVLLLFSYFVWRSMISG